MVGPEGVNLYMYHQHHISNLMENVGEEGRHCGGEERGRREGNDTAGLRGRGGTEGRDGWHCGGGGAGETLRGWRGGAGEKVREQHCGVEGRGGTAWRGAGGTAGEGEAGEALRGWRGEALRGEGKGTALRG